MQSDSGAMLCLKAGRRSSAALGHHIRCQRCGKRGPRLSATPEPATLADPFPRSEAEWQTLRRHNRD